MSLAPVEQEVTSTDEVVALDVPWVTIVWNDPVNLMTYVTWVFQTYFGYSRSKAEKLMMDVHVKGRAVVSNGARERWSATPRRCRATASGPPSRRTADGPRLPARARALRRQARRRPSAARAPGLMSRQAARSRPRSSRPATRSTTSSPRWDVSLDRIVDQARLARSGRLARRRPGGARRRVAERDPALDRLLPTAQPRGRPDRGRVPPADRGGAAPAQERQPRRRDRARSAAVGDRGSCSTQPQAPALPHGAHRRAAGARGAHGHANRGGRSSAAGGRRWSTSTTTTRRSTPWRVYDFLTWLQETLAHALAP